MSNTKDISIIIPYYNEEESLKELYRKCAKVLNDSGKDYELIFIDDGSTDGSYNVVKQLKDEHGEKIKSIKFRTNSGKAKALNEGFKQAEGEIVFTMDADLQDDPKEIPAFLKKIDEGYDLVSGWKKKRHDPLEKRLPSKLFNRATSIITGLKLHDFNCGFKAYKNQIIKEVKVYGELHRYIPALAHWQGYKVGEIPVKHHARKYGSSKYGWERYLRGLFDLLTVILLTKYIRNPLYLYGFFGIGLLIVGITILSFLTILQIMHGSILGHRPLSFLSVLTILSGGQLISLGLMAEFLTSISQSKGNTFVSIKNRRINKIKDVDVSIVVPIRNEIENLEIFTKELQRFIQKSKKKFEIIYVDDGSDDGSSEKLENIATKYENITLLKLRKAFGKASALNCGFKSAKGNIIITMDGDLQDDPENIPRFLNGIAYGYDFVCGKRINVPLKRKITSKMFNYFVSAITRVKLSDINCGFKAFRSDVIRRVNIYGGLQRFMPVIMTKQGFKYEEVPVPHRDRLHGVSKYGWMRIPKGFLDLLTVMLITAYRRRPLHLLGGIGLMLSGLGFCICFMLTLLKITTGSIQGHNTMLLLGVMLLVLGFQWLTAGLLGEMINNLDEQITTDTIVEKDG